MFRLLRFGTQQCASPATQIAFRTFSSIRRGSGEAETLGAIEFVTKHYVAAPQRVSEALGAMSAAERRTLLDALRKAEPRLKTAEDAFRTADANADGVVTREEFAQAVHGSVHFEDIAVQTVQGRETPSWLTLARVAGVSSIPFVGFGFCDNAIMILSGDAIQAAGGVALGLSTMAAAGFGNMVSDVLGIGISGWIESACERAGLRPPLTGIQLAMPRTRFVIGFGRCFGIAIGCTLGMFPLLFSRAGERTQPQAAETDAAAA